MSLPGAIGGVDSQAGGIERRVRAVSSSDQPDALLGQVVAGRYEVLRKLNEGGMGAVYLAMQQPLDRPVALKVLLKKYADDATAIRRF